MQIDLAPAAGLDLSQYFGIWAHEETRFAQQLHAIQTMDLSAHIAANAARDVSRPESSNEGAVLVVDVEGSLTKRGSSLSAAGSMVRLGRTIRNAARDPEVAGIIIRIDSPGGTVSGTADLGDEIRNAAKQKPTWAFVEDLAASAGYWLASQAGRVIANNRTAQVGSIGVYMGLYDVSRMAEEEGVEAVVIKAGSDLKGTGFPGAKVTDEQKAYLQELVDNAHAEFRSAITAGRNLSGEALDRVSTGRVWPAHEAMGLGLVDSIQSFDQTLADMRAEVGKQQRSRPMAAASYVEILEACDGIDPQENAADSRFICAQQNSEASVEQVRSAWMKELRGRAEAARAEADEQRQAVEVARSQGTAGVDPVEEAVSTEPVQSAREEWNEKLSAVSGMSRAKAVAKVNRENPGLRERMLAEVN